MTAGLVLCGAPAWTAEPSVQSRTISYQEEGAIPVVYIMAGFKTEVIIPDHESIVRVDFGNSYFEGKYVGHIVVIKALGSKHGERTNMLVMAASGNEYSFILEEVSNKPQIQADLKVIVTRDEAAATAAMLEPPKLYTSDQVEVYQEQLKSALDALSRERANRGQIAAQSMSKEANLIRHDYKLVKHKGENFHATAWHDDKFSYVEIDTQEAPALYEVKDGKLSLIEKNLANGRYTIPKIVDHIVLKVGKSESEFKRIDPQG